ncbi:Hypothetical predicted protein [Xyrichtys novacula]|uniref:Uncharacterized protein n=1 Tax=Xyrichtys novacula TaxID=13765 RepID=A0AAV1FEG3_XYRNO|nr:Hypothetical predicted protein [Xyrichtys novacula]
MRRMSAETLMKSQRTEWMICSFSSDRTVHVVLMRLYEVERLQLNVQQLLGGGHEKHTSCFSLQSLIIISERHSSLTSRLEPLEPLFCRSSGGGGGVGLQLQEQFVYRERERREDIQKEREREREGEGAFPLNGWKYQEEEERRGLETFLH